MKKTSLSTIKEILKQNHPSLSRRYGVNRLGIFGSFAKGLETDQSDIDLIVDFDKPVGFFTYLTLENELEQILGRPVDLVTNNALKETIKDRILKNIQYV